MCIRDRIINLAVELLKNETININLEEPWRERNLVRIILYKANLGHVNHLTNHDLFCKDFKLYKENISCSVNEKLSGCKTLIDANSSSNRQQEKLTIIEDAHKGCK